MKTARAILLLSFLISTTVAAAKEYVKCDIGLQIMYEGKPNHLNLLDVRGVLLNDDGDKWHVVFYLPHEYKYTQGPDLWVNGNSCRYEKPPVTYDGN